MWLRRRRPTGAFVPSTALVRRRPRRLLALTLVLLGGLALRFAMVEGGRLSARDPQATFSFARGENLPLSEDEV